MKKEHMDFESSPNLNNMGRLIKIGLWEYDIITGHVTCTDEVYNIYGVKKDFNLNNIFEQELEFYAPKCATILKDAFRKALEYGKSFDLEVKFILHDGSSVEVRIIGMAVKKDGKVVRLTGSIMDITGQKSAEEEENYHSYKVIFETFCDPIMILEPPFWNFTMGNPATIELFKAKSKADFMSSTPWKLSPLCQPDGYSSSEKAKEMIEIALQKGYHIFEWIHKRFDGEEFPAIVNLTRIEHSGKQFLYATVRDITEQKRGEEALRESEEKFRAMVETLPLAIHLSTGTEQKCEYLNPTFIKLFGYNIEEIPTGAEWFSLAYPDEQYRSELRKLWLDNITRAMDAKTAVPLFEEVMVTCKDGSKKYISWGYITLGEKNYSYGIDVTKRKFAEEERKKLQEQLAHSQKLESIGRLAGGVAHDFNNMLVVIMGHVELLLLGTDPSEPIYEDLQAIRMAADRSANLTRQLLAFARKQTILPRIIDLNEIIGGMLNMFKSLIGEDITLNWNPASSLKLLKMDSTQIDQIMANLLVNARDSIDGVGRIIIETKNKFFDRDYCAVHTDVIPGEYVMLSVSDSGCGMDRETLANIFEPFFTTKELGIGTGLGLATVYGIVKQNNGFINVYSEPDKGTIFRIYFPRYLDLGESTFPQLPEEEVRGGMETVLLVEDELMVIKLSKDILEKLGYTVITAATPTEAVSIARDYTGEINLLLTDVVMPEMDGFELSKKILSLYPKVKCLFMSGYTANVIAHHGILEKGVHFIQKPFSMKELAKKVREVLE